MVCSPQLLDRRFVSQELMNVQHRLSVPIDEVDLVVAVWTLDAQRLLDSLQPAAGASTRGT